jgi:hypothetical protein
MSAGPLSNSSSQIQPNAVPRTAVQDRPDVLALFHSSGGTAEKMSADRSNLIEVVTQAADASDRCRGNSRRPSSSEWSVVRSKMWSSESYAEGRFNGSSVWLGGCRSISSA